MIKSIMLRLIKKQPRFHQVTYGANIKMWVPVRQTDKFEDNKNEKNRRTPLDVGVSGKPLR